MPQRVCRVVFQLTQDAGLDHLGWKLPAADGLAVEGQAHVALGALCDRVGPERKVFVRFLADDGFLVTEENDAGREDVAPSASHHRRAAPVVEVRDSRVGRAQVDADSAGRGHGDKTRMTTSE